MFVNTGGVGKTQQQQPLQNQINASIRQNNPYTHSHTQQQPHYEHHQRPVTFVTYPFCNVASAAHGSAAGNNAAVNSGQVGHILFQRTHQPQTQPHHTPQQVGLHNAEQALHYFAKSTALPAHQLRHTTQHHPQIRNMISTVPHQQPSYVVSPTYFALSHTLLSQQNRASVLTNPAPQNALASSSGGPIAAQLQNAAGRSMTSSGPTSYIQHSYCTPPLLLSAAPTAVTSQRAPMLTAATGIGQPPSLQMYTHMSSPLSTNPSLTAPINMQNVTTGVETPSNIEHNTNTKQRKYAIPILHPDTLLEVVTSQSQTKSNINVESVSVQTEFDKSLTVSIASDISDDMMILPTRSQSISATDTDKIDPQIENEEGDNAINKCSKGIGTETFAFIPDDNITTQQPNLNSESLEMCACEDSNDTDADTNEHELDNEDGVPDAIDGNISIPYFDQPELPENISIEKTTEEIPNTNVEILQSEESDTDHSLPAQAPLDKNEEEEESKDIPQDLQRSVPSVVVTESKKSRKNRKVSKRKEKNNQKKLKQQQNKLSDRNVSTENDEINTSILLKSTNFDNKDSESKDQTRLKKEISQPKFLRYSLAELKEIANLPESRKTPVVPCQKGDCISQLFVVRQQQQQQVGQNLQNRLPQTYHQMNFNESIEFVSSKRWLSGGLAVARKNQELNISSTGTRNNISGVQVVPRIASVGSNMTQLQTKKQLIHINLSLNEEIKLSECKNAWRPKVLFNISSTAESNKNSNDNIEDVLKKVRGILNKLTSENFEILLKEMTGITINTQEKMQKIMLLIFEKIVSEPNFASTYAKFCKVLFEKVKAESREVFNSLLIKRLEKEFKLNVNNANAKERKLQQIINKLNNAKDQQEKLELQAELEYQESQFRRRAWGTVRFIGEMYKLHSLSANCVFQYVESLLNHGNEEKLEYMCKLLITVGNILESGNESSFNNNARMNKIFEKIQAILKDMRDGDPKKKIKICSRVRFMMQDLIDLRCRNWGQSPAQRRQQSEEKNNYLNTFERGSMQRMSYGNNNRNNQTRTKEYGVAGSIGNFFTQKSSKSQFSAQREQQSIDLKKLIFSRGDDSSQANTELGNKSTYMWRQTHQSIDLQQTDRSTPTSQPYSQKHNTQNQQHIQYWDTKKINSNSDIKAILESCSSKDNQKLLNQLMEEYLDCLPSRSNRWQEEVLIVWQKNKDNQQICLVYHILMNYLHLAAVKRFERNACANIFIYLMSCDTFHKTIFTRAYEQFAAEFPDLLMDVPNGWTYVFQFLGPLLNERLITFDDIWHTNWRNDQIFTERFVNALVVYFTQEFGANYMRDLWHNEFKLDRGQLFKSDQQQWHDFVEANKLKFLYDSKAKPDIKISNANNNSATVADQHLQRLETLLTSHNNSNLALDYINTNVNINTYFFKNLIRFLCCDFATVTQTSILSSSQASSATASKNSSTCSNASNNSGTINKDLPNINNNNNNINLNKYPQLNVDTFRKNCLPLLRLCLDAHEDNELTCLDSVVNCIQQEYDTIAASELICGIFDIFYDCEVIAKESFEKWFKQRQQQEKKHTFSSKNQTNQSLYSSLETYMQKIL